MDMKRQKIVDLRRAGHTYSEIAEKTGVTYGSVAYVLRRAGLTRKRIPDISKRKYSLTVNGQRACRTCGRPTNGNWWYCPVCHRLRSEHISGAPTTMDNSAAV